jgi:hypothetical protein
MGRRLSGCILVLSAAVACSSSKKDGGGFGGNGPDGTGTFGGPVAPPDPKNAEIADNNADDDGDGKVDNVAVCDSGLQLNAPPEDFAKAIGICDMAATRGFGLVSATFSDGYNRTSQPAPGQWGLLPRFGKVIVPREGTMLGAISTGFAREYDSPDGSGEKANFVDVQPLDGTGYPTGAAPHGFPRPAQGCFQDANVNDMIDVKLVLKAPPNAQGFKFDFNFHSSEWPGYVCSAYNDSFIAYLSARGFNGGRADNISFDAKGNPVSVNNGFFDRCTPNTPTGCAPFSRPGMAACPGGATELEGTGFGLTLPICDPGHPQTAGGATGWLTTQAPVQPGEEFTIEFMIWDTGDGVLDSLALIDKFRWIGAAVETGTTRPPR